jgi:signal transduction histidine kinase
VSLGPVARARHALDRLSGAGRPAAGPGRAGHDALHRVRVEATRVALISTAIVAVVYLVISVAVVLIVTARETSGIDAQLSRALARSTAGGGVYVTRTPGASLWYWLIATDGTQFVCDPQGGQCTTPSGNGLSASIQDVGASPQTVSIAGDDFRVVGTDTSPVSFSGPVVTDPVTNLPIEQDYTLARLVIGQSLSGVSSAAGNTILAETIVGPILLVAVFLGALTIGRRVAVPIEQARVRQLEFTADASHELRTPLSVIEAQTSLALAEPRDPIWYHAAFQRVQGESGRIRHLVEDLLWLARFDSTRERAQAEHVDVAILARLAADRFTAVAEAKGVRLSVRTAPVPLVVHAPPEWLDRLLGVLLDNACKYAPEGGTIDVSVGAEGNRIHLSVDDSGPGIPAAERPRIFDRFRRATDRPGGAGLGLAIANSVVTATGGRWQIGDSPAGGASMGVSWPRSLAGAPEPDAPREAVSPVD